MKLCWILALVAVAVHATAAQAPQKGDRAPRFALPDAEGKEITLDTLSNGANAVVIVFYRGYW